MTWEPCACVCVGKRLLIEVMTGRMEASGRRAREREKAGSHTHRVDFASPVLVSSPVAVVQLPTAWARKSSATGSCSFPSAPHPAKSPAASTAAITLPNPHSDSHPLHFPFPCKRGHCVRRFGRVARRATFGKACASHPPLRVRGRVVQMRARAPEAQDRAGEGGSKRHKSRHSR